MMITVTFWCSCVVRIQATT